MLKVEHISKSYGSITALKDLSFRVRRGEVCGILGANGAGKSTAISIIAGVSECDSGQVSICGYDIARSPKEARANLGYLSEIPQLYNDMTALEYMLFVASAKGLRGGDMRFEVRRVMKRLDLVGVHSRLIGNLSKGYRQRVGIAQALLASPAVIVFDEPTSGLDPRQINEFRELVCELRSEHAILFSSHILSEAEDICDNMLIMSHGTLAAAGSKDELCDRFLVGKGLNVRVRGTRSAVREALSSCKDLRFAVTHEDGGLLTLSFGTSGPQERERLFFAFANASLPILSMDEGEKSLEDVFLRITSDAVMSAEVK